jgi:hypothetical protein
MWKLGTRTNRYAKLFGKSKTMKDDIEFYLLLDAVYIFFGYYLVFRPGKILQELKAWKRILSLSQFLKGYLASLALKNWWYRKKDDLQNCFWMYVQKEVVVVDKYFAIKLTVIGWTTWTVANRKDISVIGPKVDGPQIANPQMDINSARYKIIVGKLSSYDMIWII